MKLEELDGVFVDGRIIDVSSTSIEVLEQTVEKIRMQRVQKIEEIANIVEQIKQ